jgi:hypothetical protein
VTTYIDSLAASAGSFIAMAGEDRIIARTGQMMIHDAHGLAIGNATDMRELAELLDMNSDNIAGIYAERAGGTTASWRKAMKNETWYSAAESVKANLATEILQTTGSGADNSWDLSIFNYAGRANAPAPELPVEDAHTPPDEKNTLTVDPDEFRRAMMEAFQ